MINKIKKIISSYERKEIVLLAFYPLFIIPFTAYSLIRTMINVVCSLFENQWKYLTGNVVHFSFSNYFYFVQDINLQKFGRYGDSDLVAGGRGFSLKNWFHTMPLALRLQAILGVVPLLFFSMVVWIGSWFFISEITSMNIVIILFSIFSTYFFITFIDQQNYNVLAWALLPFVFYALFEQDYYLYSSLLLVMAFFSFTAIFIVLSITMVFVLYWQDLFLFLSIFPAVIKLSVPILMCLFKGALYKMLGALGAHDDVKYYRDDKRISLQFLYVSILNLFFMGAYFYQFGIDGYLLLQVTVFFLFIINSVLARFADKQTFHILFLSVFTFCLLDKDWNVLTFVAYLFAINPLYLISGFSSLSNPVFPEIRDPINTKGFIQDIDILIKDIEEKKRTLFLFNNPENQYKKLFDGFRVIVEPILYCFHKKGRVVFPDWFYLYEYNKLTDTDLIWWNHDEEQLRQSIKAFDVDYILTYEKLFDGNVPTFLKKKNETMIDYINQKIILYKVDH